MANHEGNKKGSSSVIKLNNLLVNDTILFNYANENMLEWDIPEYVKEIKISSYGPAAGSRGGKVEGILDVSKGGTLSFSIYKTFTGGGRGTAVIGEKNDGKGEPQPNIYSGGGGGTGGRGGNGSGNKYRPGAGGTGGLNGSMGTEVKYNGSLIIAAHGAGGKGGDGGRSGGGNIDNGCAGGKGGDGGQNGANGGRQPGMTVGGEGGLCGDNASLGAGYPGKAGSAGSGGGGGNGGGGGGGGANGKNYANFDAVTQISLFEQYNDSDGFVEIEIRKIINNKILIKHKDNFYAFNNDGVVLIDNKDSIVDAIKHGSPSLRHQNKTVGNILCKARKNNNAFKLKKDKLISKSKPKKIEVK